MERGCNTCYKRGNVIIVMSKQKCIKTLQSIEATQQNKRHALTKH